ncbi:hypothetical protein I6F50_07455 [Pseudoalteromonas sp. NZS127_1]|uniref:hypothetical protein n=1 Tax=unclassified Pseudoalteromonas TaxID=194690 RepID=UPI0013FDD5EA|nr:MULTISPECIES: hypothetical protein [unclassified Pseudoalteromonas]MBG9994889.1 hypothetical protein [Pseudoalteromonas sp. NZS127_1]MBH0012263.1 hypothetical protein [Pseudoalteromonas sp. NZS100_1]MBH0042514.1 hypothetical protein [Pseudoalteromonas sp. SWXJZ10B]
MLKTIIAEARNQPISFVGSIASIIAIINTFYAVPTIIFGYNLIPIRISVDLVFVACLFFLLEGSLASVFGRIYIYFCRKGSGYPLMLMCVNAIISASVTGFNCIWMFVNTVESNNKYSAFSFTMFIGYLISLYFLHSHCQAGKTKDNLQIDCDKDEIEEKYTKWYWVSFFLNTCAFIFIFIYLIDGI